jgi:RNA polymerase primary sigma factor
MSEKTESERDCIGLYMKEISRFPLLSREEEQIVARRAAAGNKAAREKLINANLRFVVKIAKQYQNQGLPLDDLISEGNVGLIKAVDRFDVEKGYRFISYAVWWIRQAIFFAICHKAKIIRLPVVMMLKYQKIQQIRKQLRKQMSYNEEVQEIAAILNMDEKQVEYLLDISRDMVSLENTMAFDTDITLKDYIEDTQYVRPEQNMEKILFKQDLDEILNSLSKKEANIIRAHYGIGMYPAMSLKEISERYKLSRERVRQIEARALVRLQNPARLKTLKTYVA